MLVSVYLGPRPYAGFEVTIESVQQDGEKLVVRYRELQPRRDANHLDMITSPMSIARVPRSDGPVEFVALPAEVR